MKYLNIIALAFITSVIFSCTKNNDTTIVLLGKESYVKEISKIIPDTLRPCIDSVFDIHEGYIPPKVEGKFKISPKQRVYSNTDSVLTIPESDMIIDIENQHNRVAHLTQEEAGSTTTDTVYVVGHDNYFTLYYIKNTVTQTMGYETNMKRAMFFSGEIDAIGIKNLQLATIIMDVKDNSGGLIVTYKPGDFFIYKDGDGKSERITD